MANHSFPELVCKSPGRFIMPIGAYTGANWTGASVKDIVSNPTAQVESVLAIHEHFHPDALLTAMDLSAEAEAFGAEIRVSEDEIPTVIGRHVSSLAEIVSMVVPKVGEKRTRVYLDTANQLYRKFNPFPVMGGMIGPFSLAGRLFGVSEILEASASEGDLVLAILEKTTAFLSEYALAYREVGASGVIIAEPTAGLLSPKSLARFSAPYIKRIVEQTQTESFTPILHNCGARLAHLEKTLESGARIYHFGAPMDLPKALETVGDQIILGGNIDPAGVLFNGRADEVRLAVHQLLEKIGPRRNFILSSGCDIPPGTPLENIEAFFDEGRQ